MYLGINTNDYVLVRLTPRGREVLRENHDKLYDGWGRSKPIYAPPAETCGWSKWQLWRLMQEFGEHTYNGAEVCFETEIRIPLDQ